MYLTEEVNTIFNKNEWGKVNNNLLAKMLSEFMYEELIKPELVDVEGEIGTYSLQTPNSNYIFKASKKLFDSYYVYVESIKVQDKEGKHKEIQSCISFLMDIQKMLNMSPKTTAYLIKELNNTLVADLHILKKDISSDEIVELDYAEIEGEMNGHPWITYNKGRIGFGYDDYLKFAPESKKKTTLLWIAVSKKIGVFNSVEGLSYEDLINNELTKEELNLFNKLFIKENLSTTDYYFMPVHEWQWKNVIITHFAEDIASNKIILLGEGEQLYLPQQSIRTFVNASNNKKNHVKLPMSILNTLVYRGLPGERTVIAPRVTEFIKDIYNKDSFLNTSCKFDLLGEIASINYDHSYYSHLEGAPYQLLELLGVIWRESIYNYVSENEKPITLAALLHKDNHGKYLITSLIEKSNLSIKEWLNSLFEVTLSPLLHYLYQYGVVFSPHGQNTVLVLKDYKPYKLIMKDFVDDVNVSDQPLPELKNLNKELKQVLRTEPPHGLTQFIFTGLFICHFRYLSTILDEHHNYAEEDFWKQVKETITNYQEKFPELKERFETFDLFNPYFTKLCLNRNRMIDYGYNDDDDRPHASEYGKVKNALYHIQPLYK
ncbi:IucA/IucC family protein [Bacillus basilensis]|uniref:IucA/IucC family protein n=1 Tax=Bacillus basilensis TaxID=3243721 RepID=UPI003D660E74